jgi:hypothetical protein
MDTGQSGTVVRRHEIPTELRAAAGLTEDYVDLFVGTSPDAGEQSAEHWARATMEGASPVGRFLAWQTVLGLRLAAGPSGDHVAGWRIAARHKSWIRLEARSWFMTARIVFAVDGDEVAFATFIRYDRLPARAVWPAVAVIHRAVAPDFVRGGIARVRSGERARLRSTS